MGAIPSDSGWDELYPETVAIEKFSTVRDERNEAGDAWAPVPNMAALRCAVKFSRGEEVQTSGGAVKSASSNGARSGLQSAISSHVIKLQTYTEGITTQMRARQGNIVFEILAVAHTSGRNRTRLYCQKTKP